jgi:uncharacterized protein YwqG/predicted DNA-binding WGR domain protein
MRRFELKEKDSTKFWEIELSDKTLTVRFGQEKSTEYPWPQIAEKEHDKVIAERLRKGYKEIKDAEPQEDDLEAANAEKDLVSAVRRYGALKRVAAQLTSLQRLSLRITTGAVKGKSVGISKLGGRPDLPPDLSWPIGKVAGREIALPFIAQFDATPLWRAYMGPGAQGGLLPNFGMLYFFYNMADYGKDYLSPENWRVLYTPSHGKDKLAPSEPPLPIPPHLEYKTRAAKFQTEATLPNIETSYIGLTGNADAKVELTQEEWDAYAELRYELRSNQTIHQMMGHADDVQPYALENSYESVRDTFFSDGRAFKDLTRKEQSGELFRGRLLLQIDTDKNMNMTFGRGGRLFFFIRDKDLIAKDFSKVWVNEQ